MNIICSIKGSLVSVLCFCMLGLSPQVSAQNIELDHPVRCGSLQCFPVVDKPHQYLYLPSKPRIAMGENGKHEFSFTRYVLPTAVDSGDGGLLDAEGGGIVHFLVDYTVTPEELTAALAGLKAFDRDAKIRGPVVFDEGSFALVSSFAADDDKPNELTRHVVGVGRAPLIEGLKAAVSIHLTKTGAQILWRSFQMQTPDVSLVFEMTFSGLRDPADATITADWKKLSDQADVTLGAKVGYMGIGAGFDYGNFWQAAQDSGAINIEYRGDPAQLQGIIDRAYARLHEMMFEPIKITQPEPGKDDDLLDTMSAVMQAAAVAGGGSYAAPWEVKLNGGYRRRKLSQTGTYTFNFKQRGEGKITTAMAGNVGNLFALYGKDSSIFNTVNVGSPEFRIREISVALDARDEQEFAKYINHVTLKVRKTHGSGEQSTDEVVIKRSNFEAGRPMKVNYGWDHEANIESWLNYQYKADWSFVGGAKHSQDWTTTDSAALALTPPYQYREIEFISSPDLLEAADVRLVSVRVTHDFFGRTVSETINLIPSRDQFSERRVFAIPPGEGAIEYVITWTLNDKRRISSGKMRTNETIIFCDELPGSV